MAVRYGLGWLFMVLVLSGCSLIDEAPGSVEQPAAVAAPTVPLRPTDVPRPTTTPVPRDTGWQLIFPGVEYRELKVTFGDRSDRLYLARIDPAQTRFRVLYDPDRPRRISDWLTDSKALLVVNGNYFDPQNRALGLVIQDGQVVGGAPYQGFGGMFAVSGDNVRVRWNVDEPYGGESLNDALQNFPMLVLPGGQPNPDIDDNQNVAPRTAVGQDRSGRIVFAVSPGLAFTLTDFSQWLSASDLDLDRALNLDGGTSSGLVLRRGDQNLGTDSWVAVPDVIVVEAK
jgi:uncharacterized protein YigE (DUF2233 family)